MRLTSLPMPSLARLALLAPVLVAAGCAVEPKQAAAPAPAPEPPPAPVVVKPAVDENARAEEAKAMLAQAETDIQRARSRRALWLKAWEELISARRAAAENDSDAAIRHSRRASELALLGLEQLAYPALK